MNGYQDELKEEILKTLCGIRAELKQRNWLQAVKVFMNPDIKKPEYSKIRTELKKLIDRSDP